MLHSILLPERGLISRSAVGIEQRYSRTSLSFPGACVQIPLPQKKIGRGGGEAGSVHSRLRRTEVEPRFNEPLHDIPSPINNKIQPSPQAFSARSFLDSTMNCDVTERYSALSSRLRADNGSREKRECSGTRLNKIISTSI